MKTLFYDPGDYCLRTSLFVAGAILQNGVYVSDCFETMCKDCRLHHWFGHRKSYDYTWEKDQHNGKKTIRCYLGILYRKIFGKSLYCGLNCDQYRALFIVLYLMRRYPFSRKIARRIIFGYIIRLGFSPSLTEWAIFKPQTFVLLFRMFGICFPINAVLLPIFKITAHFNLLEPIEKSTTNKISLLPTMFVLRMKMPTDDYIREVYNTYFSSQEQGGQLIRHALIKALTKYD